MTHSLQIFMTRIIDYAGLFPPAQLDMSDAIDEYLMHRDGAEGWMLARFVCPASRLAELLPLLDRHRDQPVVLSVLGRGGDTPASFAAAVEQDVEEIAAATGGQQRAVVDQYEVRLPTTAEASQLATAVNDAITQLSTVRPIAPTPFFEESILGNWRERIPAAVKAVVEGAGATSAGFKIRCGGANASAIPSPAAVAASIAICRRFETPLKATQGLHHPVRHFDRRMETMAHGFLNLFITGMLALACELPEDRLLEVLEEDDPSAFSFSDERAAWRDLELDIEQIASGRRHAVASFGSCSFVEPRDNLLALGLLDQPS
jgi:hypothetical protein